METQTREELAEEAALEMAVDNVLENNAKNYEMSEEAKEYLAMRQGAILMERYLATEEARDRAKAEFSKLKAARKRAEAARKKNRRLAKRR